MRVRFRTRRLQRQAESESLARRGYGLVVGRRFIQRVDALEEASAFESLFQVRAFDLHRLRGDRAGSYAMRLTGFDRLILTYDEAADEIWIEKVSKHYGD